MPLLFFPAGQDFYDSPTLCLFLSLPSSEPLQYGFGNLFSTYEKSGNKSRDSSVTPHSPRIHSPYHSGLGSGLFVSSVSVMICLRSYSLSQ
jgi:hypothetical protein